MRVKGFANPIALRNAPDPFMVYDPVTAYYYALFTCGDRLELFRSREAEKILVDEDSKVVFRAGAEHGIYGCVWAPEMHKAPNGLWYIYTSGSIVPGDGEKRLFIMESESEDPFDGFHFKCRPAPALCAIDPTVYTRNGRQYVCYSKVAGADGQVLEIREMENPWTFGEKRAVIAKAEYSWELVPPYDKMKINEGAFFVEQGNRLYIVYSGNGCWSDDYCMGALEYMGGDLCDASSWVKHEEPFFTKGNGLYGPGHASFFRRPEEEGLWCAYHAMLEHNERCEVAPRYFNIQKIEFDENGYFVPTMPKREIDPAR